MPFRVKHSSFFQFGQNLATKTWPNSGQFPRVAGMFPTFSKLAKIRVRKDSADAGDYGTVPTRAGGAWRQRTPKKTIGQIAGQNGKCF